MNFFGMFRVDAKTAVKIPDIERGRVLVFVKCLECGYYMFLSLRLWDYSEVVSIKCNINVLV